MNTTFIAIFIILGCLIFIQLYFLNDSLNKIVDYLEKREDKNR
jgi:hypothetical protein